MLNLYSARKFNSAARRIGCSIETTRKIESGERYPSRQVAELLARYLNIAVDQ